MLTTTKTRHVNHRNVEDLSLEVNMHTFCCAAVKVHTRDAQLAILTNLLMQPTIKQVQQLKTFN